MQRRVPSKVATALGWHEWSSTDGPRYTAVPTDCRSALMTLKLLTQICNQSLDAFLHLGTVPCFSDVWRRQSASSSIRWLSIRNDVTVGQ